MDSQQRIHYIDGLRGLAVLGVVIYHVWRAYPALQQNYWANIVLDAGRHGVELFFVLSGFCLSYPILLRLHMRSIVSFDVLNYVARRLLRILPPYYAAIVVCAAILFVGHIAPERLLGPTDVFRQALFLDKETSLVNPSFWTLAVEFRWYFLFPLALLVWVRAPRVYGMVLVTVPVLWATNAFNLDVLFLPGFLLGVIAADISIRGTAVARYASLCAITLTLLAMATDIHNKAAMEGGFNFNPFWMTAAFSAVVSTGKFLPLRAACSANWLTAIGVASYSIYLVHQPFIFWMERLGFTPIITILAALASGFAFWWIAERPFVEPRLRRRASAAITAGLLRYGNRLGISDCTMVLVRHEEQVAEQIA